MNGNHIINPKPGKPAKTLKSLSIIADKSIDAEGLSTGFFVKGLPSLITINKMPNLSAILIDKHKNIYLTNNLVNQFVLINKKYHIKEIKNEKI